MNLKRYTYFLVLILVLFSVTVVSAQQADQLRTVIPFNDHWQFKKADYKKSFNIINADWQNVSIPHTWNATDMQTSNNFYQGDAFYKKSTIK